MASSLGYGNDNGDSQKQESDAVREMFCEQCEKDNGSKVRADGFCVECVKYFCSTCLRYHKKYKSDHTIQDSTTMPQDFYFQKCKDHSAELIKFYCNNCTQTACSICKVSKHLECVTEHLPSLVGSTDLKSEVSSMEKSVDDHVAIIAESRNEISSKFSEVKEVSQNAISSVRQHRAQLNCDVEVLYTENVRELDTKHKNEMRSFETRKAALLGKLEKEKEELHKKQQLENKNLQSNKNHTFEQIEEEEKKLIKESEKLKQGDERRLTALSSKADKIEAELKTMKQGICKKIQENHNNVKHS